MKTLTAVETAREVYAELESVGVTGAAAALVVKRTAHHRQARRERAAYEAAVAWATTQTVGEPLPDRDWGADEAHEAAMHYLADVAGCAWLACVLDASGVGGHMGLEGAKRARHPAFRVAAPKWGAGECWTAAIRTAAQRLELEALSAASADNAAQERDAERLRASGFTGGIGYRACYLLLGLDAEGDLVALDGRHKIIMGGYGCPPDREWRRAALACRLLSVLDGAAGGGLELTSARPDAERVPWCRCPQCSDPALIARALNDVESEIEHARDLATEAYGWMYWEQSNPGLEVELRYASREEAMSALVAYARRYCEAGEAAIQHAEDRSATCETDYDEGQIGTSRAGICLATKAEPESFATGVPFHLTPLEPAA